jgi:hypothetical protein
MNASARIFTCAPAGWPYSRSISRIGMSYHQLPIPFGVDQLVDLIRHQLQIPDAGSDQAKLLLEAFDGLVEPPGQFLR